MTCRIPQDGNLKKEIEALEEKLKKAGVDVLEAALSHEVLVKEGAEAARLAGKKLSPEDITKYQLNADNPLLAEAIGASNKKNKEHSREKAGNAIKEDLENGINDLTKLAGTADTPIEYVAVKLLSWNKTVGQKLRESNLNVGNYMANRLWGVPQGFGGNMKHMFTAGEHQGLHLVRFQAKFMKQYRSIMWEYGESQGNGWWGKLKLAERNGMTHPEVDRINREVYEDLNNARLGKARNTKPEIQKLVKLINAHNQFVFDELRSEGLERGVLESDYHELNFKNTAHKVNKETLLKLFQKGYENTEHSMEDAKVLSEKLVELINSSEDFSYTNTFKSRYDLLRDIDTSVEFNGVKLMDLLNTDLKTSMDKNSRTAAGWLGISKATGGAIKTHSDIEAFNELLFQEAEMKGVSKDRAQYLHDINKDNLDRLFGRPVRGGVPHELRNLMDLATLRGMGKSGASQMADSGNAAMRVLFNAHDINFVRRVLKMAGSNQNESKVVRDMHNIVGLWDGVAELMNHSRHIDEEVMKEVGKLREVSLAIADKATLGDAKAELLRGLGKVNNQDIVQKYQSRVLMSCWLLDVGRHFNPSNPGKGSMTTRRMMANGIADRFGRDADLEAGFKFAEFDSDGLLVDLNLEKWDKKGIDKLALGMFKAEATEVQRTVVGDHPTWVNPVLWQAVTQFREFSIIGTNKQLLRQIKHADIEGVTAVAINTAVAGLVKTAQYKLAVGMGNVIDGRAFLAEANDKHSYWRETFKYSMNAGAFPDAGIMLGDIGKLTEEVSNGQYGAAKKSGMDLFNQVPLFGLMDDYFTAAGYAGTGEFKSAYSKASEVLPYSNSVFGEALVQFAINQKWLKKEK